MAIRKQSIFSFRLGSSTEWSERLPMPMEVTPVKCFHWIQMTQRLVFFCSSHRPGDLVSRHDRHCFPHALCLRCHPRPGDLFPKHLFFHLVFSWWWADIRGTGWSSLACFCLLLLLPLFFLSSMLLWKYIKIKQTHNFVKLCCCRVAHAMQCNDYMSGPRCLSYKPFKS